MPAKTPPKSTVKSAIKKIPGMKIKQKIVSSFDGLNLWTQSYQNAPDWLIKNRIIMVHGLAHSGEVWEIVVEKIMRDQPRTKCIVYDLRGHGRSNKKFDHLSGTRLELIHALDLQEILQRTRSWKPILIGHSMGGIIVQEYLNLEPNWWYQPKQVFLMATNIKTRKIKNLDRQKVMTNFQKINRHKNKQAAKVDVDAYKKLLSKGSMNLRTMLRAAMSIPVESSLLHWLGTTNWENEHPERLNKRNVMLIYGEKDKLFPTGEIEETLIALPRMRRRSLKAEHALNVTQAEAVAEEIEAVLR